MMKSTLAYEPGAQVGTAREREAVSSTDRQPLVSIIMCAYNPGEYLIPAVQSALAQTYERIELLVIDDGSTDGSVEAARQKFDDERIRWFRQANAGKPASMNFAIEQAHGEFYALQDADDLSHPTRIAALVEAMQAEPECAAMFSGHELILDGRHVAPTSRAKSSADCRGEIERMRMPAHDPTAMYRLSMVRDLRYEPDLRQGEGYDYILRVGEQFPVQVLGQCLYSYRVHWSSLTRSDPDGRQQFVWEVIRRACKRRSVDFDEWFASRPKRRAQSKKSQRDNGLAAHFLISVQDQQNRGERLAAIRTGLQCARLHPFDWQYLKAALYAFSPAWVRSRVKGIKQR